MTPPRLKMELGTREEDVRDDRSRSGIPWKSQRTYKPHSVRNSEYVCTYPDDSCHATLDKHETAAHAEWHRQHREWDEQWQDEVERIGDHDETQDERIARLEGQMEFLTGLLGPSLDRILRERDPA